ncbi:hypothetical protein BH23BAC1_BH23BAC1_45560 [soil metagenome]
MNNFHQYMEELALEIGGQFQEYDEHKSVIIVPVSENRFQTVVGVMQLDERYQKEIIRFSSKVCPYQMGMDLKDLLKENGNLFHAKFSIINEFLKVEACFHFGNISRDEIKGLILEVATVADNWEYKITGLDVQ